MLSYQRKLSEKFMHNFRFKIDYIDENERLDSFLANNIPNFSRSQIQKAIKNFQIQVNSKSQKPSYSLKENDEIEVNIEENKIKLPQPQEIALDIKYEDEDIIVINKPVNMLTHPTSIENENTLVNALLNYTKSLSDLNGEFRKGIVHRLDRNTSGLLLIAKNNIAHEFLAHQIKEKTAIRKYLAIISGNIEQNEGIIDKPIGRNKRNPEKMAIDEQGKPSITKFKVLERLKGYTYLELELKTGRTHQIRVHLSSLGHPIVNDTNYGGKKINVNTNEQVLMAYSLSFENLKGEIINVKIDEDEDLRKTLNYLRSKK